MVFKSFVLCASVLLIQAVSSQYIGLANSGCGCGQAVSSQYIGLGNSGCGCGGNSGFANGIGYNNIASFAPQQGSPSFGIASAGPYNPNGIAVLSENDISGSINVCGGLPFASAVAFESALPTAGEASLNYGCGNSVGLTSAGYGAGAGLGQAGFFGANLGNGYGFSGYGCGCGCY